jgi:hypothetical protein
MNYHQLNNAFAIGDLVQIPQGTILYKSVDSIKKIILDNPTPINIIDKPTIGLVINKSIQDFYIVSIGDKEYLIKSEQMNFALERNKNAY